MNPERLAELREFAADGTLDPQVEDVTDLLAEVDQLTTERDAALADVERLRGRTHEIQQQEMAKRAVLDAEIAAWRARWERAKRWTEDAKLYADWATDPHATFWGYTSQATREALLALVTERDEARRKLAAWQAECDKVGVPYDPAGLVRHHRGNAAVAAGCDAFIETRGARAERDEARAEVERLTQICTGYTREIARLHAMLRSYEACRRALTGHLFDGESLGTREAIRSELIEQGLRDSAELAGMRHRVKRACKTVDELAELAGIADPVRDAIGVERVTRFRSGNPNG